MSTVLEGRMSQKQLVGAWITNCEQGTPGAGKTSSLRFEGDTLFSYQTPIARVIYNEKGECAFYVTSTSYSCTTQKQVNLLLLSLPDDARVFRFSEIDKGGRNELEREPTVGDCFDELRTLMYAEADKTGNHDAIQQRARDLQEFCRFHSLSFYVLGGR